MKRLMNCAAIVLMCAGISLASVTFQDGFEAYDAGVTTPSPNWSGGTNCASYLTMGVFEDAAKAHSGTKGYAACRPNSQGTGLSGIIQTASPLRPDGAGAGTLEASTWVMLGNTDSKGSGQVAFKFGPVARDEAGHFGVYLMFVSDRYNKNRRLVYFDGATAETVAVNFPVDEYMNVNVTMDETAQTWGFSVAKADGTILSEDAGMCFKTGFDGTVSTIGFYIEDNGRNDGFYNRFDDMQVGFVPEPMTLSLLLPACLAWLRRRV